MHEEYRQLGELTQTCVENSNNRSRKQQGCEGLDQRSVT